MVKEIPPFASARYTVIPGKPHPSETAASIKDGILQNGMVRAKVDLDTGNLIEIQRNGVQGNLIDTSDGKSANEYIFLAQTDFDHLGHSSNAKITVEEDGPLVACLRIDCAAPGTNSLVRRIRLVAGADHIELSNIVDKKQAALNPHPGNADQGGDFAQHGSKESIQFAFPFHVPGGTMEMDIPLAVMQPEKDQLPGSCKNWLPVGSWVDVSSKSAGITWVTLDAPLVEIGEISATMLGSQKDPTIWRKHIAPTQTLYSWVMNNHWGTNYRAYQVGPVEFRYALRPHSGGDLSLASRFADTLTQPLLVTPASTSARTESMLRVEPEDVSVIALKPSDDGKAWIIRLLGNPTQAREVSMHWASGHATGKRWRSNLAEEKVSPVSDRISIAAEELITLRVERT